MLIYLMNHDGLSKEAMISRLNGMGSLAPSGRHWSTRSINTVLKNPMYKDILLKQQYAGQKREKI